MKSEESMAREDSKLEGTCSELAGTHFTIRKIKFDENSGVQKVQNRNNCRILPDSKRISQPSGDVAVFPFPICILTLTKFPYACADPLMHTAIPICIWGYNI
jgi:hypothetical protein